ncbi:MAG TPA: NAD(P)-binding protein [Thermodesulfobacteriota bacterium]|nr:NAD(P)-binding protein [Thermodesulfobacteriota bacterium]
MDRRTFILSSAKFISTLGLSAFYGCRQKGEKGPFFTGSILGPSYDLGHRLLEGQFPPLSLERKVPVVIVGAGISGLSAGWKLTKAGFHEFEIYELEPEAGGVSRSGENSISPFPWGAHYIPLPTEESRAVRELFEDLGIIESRTPAGHPLYGEKYLCFSPQERLYIHGKWQEGFLPVLGAAKRDLDQFQRFRDLILHFKHRRGKDGRKAFAIPMERSSRDADLLALDRISILELLRQHGLDSARLHWYVNYACRDDYGCHYSRVSSWAGLHYFCSRDGGGEGEESAVLTWPEGNGWIVKKLERRIQSRIQADCLIYRLADKGKEVWVDVYLRKENVSIRIRAQRVIWAGPRIFARRVMAENSPADHEYLRQFHYSPWLVANLSLRSLPVTRSGMPIAWDNVIYDSPSLGYVVATHQSLATQIRKTVLTYYYAMAGGPPVQERIHLLHTSWKDWADFILKDLSRPHPEMRDLVTHLDIFRWGHAMVQPQVGFIWGSARRQAAQPRGNIYFAHSDLSGFSIFEEAQYRGVLAAERILAKFNIPFSSSL